ncbi:TfoX/Sxy family protein [Jatrophihabitans sp. YIM 134969]
MAYDTETADRLRECLATTSGVSEKAMFGGLSFLVDGHMAVAVSGSGGLLLRCAPERTEELAAREHVDRWEMRGKQMTGWLRVDPPAYESDDDLGAWVAIGVAQARVTA